MSSGSVCEKALGAHRPRVASGIDAGALTRESKASADSEDCAPVEKGGESVSPTQRKLKYVATINDEALGEETDPDLEIQYIDIGNVESSGSIGEVAIYRFGDAPSRARRRVRDGDVIVSTVRTYLQAIAQVRNPGENTVVSTGFAVVRPLPEFDANYCKYALRECGFLAEIERRSVGANYPAINAVDLANIPVHIHPLARQRAIADYLDRETARLDSLVEAKERLLYLLAEKRMALIAHAVAGGIDAGTLTRESEASADGEGCAPVGKGGKSASPTQRRLKYVATINDEALGEETDPNLEIQYIDIGNVESSGSISEVSTYRFGDAPSRARRRVRDGDVIVSTVRTYLQAIAQVRNPDENTVVSTGFAVVRPLPEFDANYCKYALRECGFLAEVERHSVGANYPAINAVDLANIPVYIHPLTRQRAIADRLDRETARLDELAARTRDTVALLKERRGALVAAAVTGQIDVENPE